MKRRTRSGQSRSKRTTANDLGLVEKVARQFIEKHGAEAVPVLREHAERAAAMGDTLSAETWREIAEMVQRLLDSP